MYNTRLILVLCFILSFLSSSIFAQDQGDKKGRQLRVGVGLNMYWTDDGVDSVGSSVVSFAVGDANKRFQKLLTVNTSISGNLWNIGYQVQWNTKYFQVGPGIMINRWAESSLATTSDALHRNRIEKKIDYILVPYVEFGSGSSLKKNGNSGIYFAYRIGPTIWSHNNTTKNSRSYIASYSSCLAGLYHRF